jgi:hypothetical protein
MTGQIFPIPTGISPDRGLDSQRLNERKMQTPELKSV